MVALGRLERVELRTVWIREDTDFTRWLAQPENLEVLGETLGIDLELEAQEKDVGPFRADILCKNTAEEDSWVVIENQIGKTDHKHLGQLLTYASGLKANTVVWIASEFCDEHRAALNWLNQMANKSVRFFGLQIELWKIGESAPAPRFNIACQPNDWENIVQRTAESLVGSEGSALQSMRLKYWTEFRSYLRDSKSKLRPQKASTNYWFNFGIGNSRAHIGALLINRDKKIGVVLYIPDDIDKRIIKDLLLKKSDIESKMGLALEWSDSSDTKASRVDLSCPVRSFDETNWPEQFSWLKSNLERFDDVFRPLFAKVESTEQHRTERFRDSPAKTSLDF